MKLLEKIQHALDVTIPDKEELTHGSHPTFDYILLWLRNLFVAGAGILFIASFFFSDAHNYLKSLGYIMGSFAYLFECLAITDCFEKKVPHTEMFMVYCFGPLYILMGVGYIFWH